MRAFAATFGWKIVCAATFFLSLTMFEKEPALIPRLVLTGELLNRTTGRPCLPGCSGEQDYGTEPVNLLLTCACREVPGHVTALIWWLQYKTCS